MVKIEESRPIKVSGKTSLLISFPYNPAILDIVKSCQPAVWHKKICKWEIPICYLAQVLDSLTMLDDIELNLFNEKEKSSKFNLIESEIKNFKVSPFPHQIEAINFLLNQKKGLLLDGMGLGKSLEMMYLAETLKARGLAEHCLVICGVDSLRSNWKKEIQKFSKESVIVLGERITKTGKTVYDTISKRAEQLLNPIDEFFVVVNIATLRSEEIIEAFKKTKNNFQLICIDEVHRCANKKSIQGNNLLRLESEYKVGATGTLITNSPLSAYLPLYWTENDKATLTNYKSQYCEFGGFNNSQVIGYKNLDVLKDELDACSIRRTFAEVKSNMPKKTVEYELVDMSPEHQKFYEAVKAGVKEEADKIELNTNNLLALTIRLRQATSCPNILTTHDIDSSKVLRACEIATDLLDQKEKVMILCNFIESAKLLSNKLSAYNPSLCTGEQDNSYISDQVDKFRFDSEHNLLIGTHAKMGTGLSMPECHYMILLDQPFTSAQQKQSEDRIYRIVSDQPVFIKVLLCKNTYDERVRDIVDTKQDLSDFIVDDKLTDRFAEKLRRSLFDALN